jgi:hypothetical protein
MLRSRGAAAIARAPPPAPPTRSPLCPLPLLQSSCLLALLCSTQSCDLLDAGAVAGTLTTLYCWQSAQSRVLCECTAAPACMLSAWRGPAWPTLHQPKRSFGPV